MNAPNGAAAPDPFAHLRDELEDALRPLRERRTELQAALQEVAGQEQRLVNALAALGGQRSEPVRRRRTHEQVGTNTGKNWMPSREKIERVYLAVKAAAEPVGTRELSEASGYSRETCNRALRALRDEQRVRLVGVAGQGSAHVFALMPEGDDGA